MCELSLQTVSLMFCICKLNVLQQAKVRSTMSLPSYGNRAIAFVSVQLADAAKVNGAAKCTSTIEPNNAPVSP